MAALGATRGRCAVRRLRGFGCANSRARNIAIAYANGADHIYYLRSDSMAPAIPRNARIAAKSHIGRVRRGDVLVIRSPKGVDPSVEVIVKRVVGLPGDEIAAADGRGSSIDDRLRSATSRPAL